MENDMHKRNTMLIVDDCELNRVILREMFSGTYKIQEASDGEEGWKWFWEHREEICAVLLDVVMPVMDGMDFLRLMKRENAIENIPVFLITATEDVKILKEAYELGVMDVISKPVIPYIIRRRVNSVVELFQTRRKLREKVRQQNSEIMIQAEKIIELNKGLIEALATAIEFRSGESGEHVRRIRDITRIILQNTEIGNNMTDEKIEQIALASIMHDLGKIAVSDQILNKPGKLTPEEYEVIKTHTIKGAEMINMLPQRHNNEVFQYAYDIARYHHERWDGKGYPDGLKKDEIPLWAQIVSIADVYDALVSKRIYKKAFSYEDALNMIREGQCGAFNPKLIQAFQSVEKQCRKLYV